MMSSSSSSSYYSTTFVNPSGNRFFQFSNNNENDGIEKCNIINMSERGPSSSSSSSVYIPVVSITTLEEQQQQQQQEFEFGKPTWIVGSTPTTLKSNDNDDSPGNSTTTTTTGNESLHFLMVNDDGIISRIHFDDDNSFQFENSTLLLLEDDNQQQQQQQPLYWPPTRPLLATTTTTTTIAKDDDPMLLLPNSTFSSSLLLTPFLSPDSTSVFSSAIPINTNDNGDDDDQPKQQQILYISEDQKLMFHNILKGGGSNNAREVDDTIQDVLIDGNIVYSENNNMYAIYSGSTSNRYVHGVLGDGEEGYKLNILLLDDDDDNNNNDDDDEKIPIKLVSTIELPGNSLVYEGLNPIWADIDNDGIDDILTTIAQDDEGAAMRVYFMNSDGTIRNEVSSEHIGVSGRWLHQLAVGPFGPNGEIEIIQIRTPHFDGHVRYYRCNNNNGGGSLVNVADYSQFTSHEIGSRNLDRVIVGDFNGDGIPEVVIQNQAEGCLFGLQRTNTNVEEVWRIDLPKPIYSNIAVSCTKQSGPQLLFSTDDSSLLRIRFVLPTTDEEMSQQTLDCSSGGGRAWKYDSTAFAVQSILLLFLCWRIAK